MAQAAGSLGQGLSVAIGAALAKKADNDPHCVYVLCGDGETEEGQILGGGDVRSPPQGRQSDRDDRLERTADRRHDQEDVAGLGDLEAKWKAFGWEVIIADGHDMDKILEAFAQAKAGVGNGKPKMILFKTEMGHGVDFMAGTHKWHGSVPSEEQCQNALSQLEETLGDF